jgi:hypothetical protein
MKQNTHTFFLALIILTHCYSSSFGQKNSLDKLKQLGQTVLYGTTDNAKIRASSELAQKLDSILHSPNSGLFPFDSLTSLSTLKSSDKRLIILTWNIPLNAGNFKYDGFMAVVNDKKQQVYRLRDTSDYLQTPEKLSLSPQNWYGALYYKLIETGKRDQKTYTLLGWDGNNKLYKRKIIEILEFNQQGVPIFGKSIFGQRDKKRIIFEYAPDAAFKLRYEKQGYRTKRWYKSTYSIVKKEMIVFDRLESIRPGLGLQPQFLVPTGNIIDAYLFKNGRWNLIKDIDARNPVETKSDQPLKQPTFDLVPKL